MAAWLGTLHSVALNNVWVDVLEILQPVWLVNTSLIAETVILAVKTLLEMILGLR